MCINVGANIQLVSLALSNKLPRMIESTKTQSQQHAARYTTLRKAGACGYDES